ncbi:MAG TPA: 3-beta hydroxysteroid dehydrogenase [Firmicutes bacterium]|jgi:nucleoside-diphosphate-sugar epimerase|nr:3-beta hydroxysteroid dehydrogenase [Bacillota bacterium]
MRIFVTGATGGIGSAVVRELIEAGHQVVGLARSDNSAAALTAAGAEVHRGSLDDLDSLHSGATAADGVIHLAFNNDFIDYASAVAADLRAVEAMGAALVGSGKPFVITSGTLMVMPGRMATEEDPGLAGLPRVEAENAALELAKCGVRSAVVRLAPCVHDADRQGFASLLIGLARDKGVSAYIGDGSNRWPAVHRLDAAHLFRLAVESAPAGSRLHGVGEEGIRFRDIAAAIGSHLNLAVVSISREEADKHFGWFAQVVSTDNPTSSALTQERLGWRPDGPTLIADIEQAQ